MLNRESFMIYPTDSETVLMDSRNITDTENHQLRITLDNMGMNNVYLEFQCSDNNAPSWRTDQSLTLKSRTTQQVDVVLQGKEQYWRIVGYSTENNYAQENGKYYGKDKVEVHITSTYGAVGGSA